MCMVAAHMAAQRVTVMDFAANPLWSDSDLNSKTAVTGSAITMHVKKLDQFA